MKNSAFSLIELMVVIAIIGVLAAVAVPTYQSYMISSRAAAFPGVMDALIQKAIIFNSTNGHFPNAYELGLSSTPGSIYVDSPQLLSPYLGGQALTGTFQMYITGDSCGAHGDISAPFDPQLLGLSTNVATIDPANGTTTTNTLVGCFYWNENGVINTQCSYWYGTSTVSQTGTLIPGWYNANATANWDLSNYINDPNRTAWLNAVCQ